MGEILEDQEKEKIIRAVEKYPCLYNCKLDSYHNKSIRNKAWKEVANKCNLSGKGNINFILLDCWHNANVETITYHHNYGLKVTQSKKL